MATIKDIAEKVGVSMMTVSRAFNDPEKVKEDLRQEIYDVAQGMNYIPNHAAKSLASKKTGVIQIFSDMKADDHYFTHVFAGAAHHLSENGYSIMINKRKMGNYQYDGAIFMGLLPGDDQKLYETIKKPFVLFGKSSLPIDCVDVDNHDGMKKITKHLINAGHKDIGLIRIDEDEPFSKERYEGFIEAMSEFDLPVNNIYSMPHSVEGLRENGNDILLNKRVSAYVCETDLMAYALIAFLKDHQIKVPEDISVVGFDGILFNRLSIPHITTVRQPVYEVGVKLAEVLVARIKNPEMDHQKILIKTHFEEGGSVKAFG